MAISRAQVLAVSLLVACFAFTETASSQTHARLVGYLVDVACATDPAQTSPGWARTHSRDCLLMPACLRSGYAVLTERNELVKFDAAGNKKAHSLLTKSSKPNNWLVRVSGIRSGNQMSVSKIEPIEK